MKIERERLVHICVEHVGFALLRPNMGLLRHPLTNLDFQEINEKLGALLRPDIGLLMEPL